jgi:hypothetical protein
VSEKRPDILPEFLPIYKDGETIPGMLRVSFSDGTTFVYHLPVSIGRQQLKDALKNIRNLSNMKNGYRSENNESTV